MKIIFLNFIKERKRENLLIFLTPLYNNRLSQKKNYKFRINLKDVSQNFNLKIQERKLKDIIKNTNKLTEKDKDKLLNFLLFGKFDSLLKKKEFCSDISDVDAYLNFGSAHQMG